MGRPVSPELIAADREARRFVSYQSNEARRLGYPCMTAFANGIARGTVSLIPVGDDEYMEFVGRFFWRLPEPLRQTMLVAYERGLSTDQRIYQLGLRLSRKVSRQRFFDQRKHLLILLSGYLVAVGDVMEAKDPL